MTKVPISENGKSAIDVARGAALLAGEIMQDRFEKAKEISYKGPGDIVTDVDREVEAEVFSFLASENPCMNLVGEESSHDLRIQSMVPVITPMAARCIPQSLGWLTRGRCW